MYINIYTMHHVLSLTREYYVVRGLFRWETDFQKKACSEILCRNLVLNY